MGVGGGWHGWGLGLPWILKLLAKKVVFSISRGKKQISPLLPPLEKILPTPMTVAVLHYVLSSIS